MPSKRKSALEKLHGAKDLPRIVQLEPEQARRLGVLPNSTMLVPSPQEVDELMRLVPRGKVTTINEIRAALARKHGVAVACPMTTGLFAHLAAEAAVESTFAGQTDTTPFWRTLKAGGALNEKYPGGVEAQKQLLEAEGHAVVPKGKHWVVENYEACLYSFD